MTSKISLSQIEVKTSNYVNTYGKAPKGFGQWAFQIGDSIGWITDTYSEAVKVAKRSAQRQGIDRIDVLS